MVVVCGLVELIATAGLATDAPDEGSGPTAVMNGWPSSSMPSEKTIFILRWSQSFR